jgi:CBS domain-containing membrane protein
MKSTLNISEDDIYEAMKDMEGFLDISMSDFRALYQHACKHAVDRLRHSTRLKEVMTTEVMSISAETTLKGIIQAMASAAVSGLPVVDENTSVIGIVSEKDIFLQLGGDKNLSFWDILLGCLDKNSCLMCSIINITAKEIMSSPAITLKADESTLTAARIFEEQKFNRLPIVDVDNHLVGIVTRSDLLRAHLLQNDI